MFCLVVFFLQRGEFQGRCWRLFIEESVGEKCVCGNLVEWGIFLKVVSWGEGLCSREGVGCLNQEVVVWFAVAVDDGFWFPRMRSGVGEFVGNDLRVGTVGGWS